MAALGFSQVQFHPEQFAKIHPLSCTSHAKKGQVALCVGTDKCAYIWSCFVRIKNNSIIGIVGAIAVYPRLHLRLTLQHQLFGSRGPRRQSYSRKGCVNDSTTTTATTAATTTTMSILVEHGRNKGKGRLAHDE